MSYILDALNKADKERKQQQTPDNVAAPKSNNIQPTSYVWLYVMVVILLVLIIAWLTSRNSQEETVLTTIPAPQAAKVIPPTPKHVETKKSSPPQPTEMPTPPVHQEKAVASKVSEVIPPILGLDQNIRDQLPRIQISAHIYSDNQQKRMVIINDRVLHEGDYLAENLILNRIKPDGLELKWKDQPFTMRVKDTWPPY